MPFYVALQIISKISFSQRNAVDLGDLRRQATINRTCLRGLSVAINGQLPVGAVDFVCSLSAHNHRKSNT